MKMGDPQGTDVPGLGARFFAVFVSFTRDGCCVRTRVLSLEGPGTAMWRGVIRVDTKWSMWIYKPEVPPSSEGEPRVRGRF